MRPTKTGQIAKFHTPLPDEDPNQLYVVLEVNDDTERPRADIKALNVGQPYTPINTVLLDDLVVSKLPTAELMGHNVTITKNDNSQVKGKVIAVGESMIDLDLNKIDTGVQTNVYLKVIDKNGIEHDGNLFVN